MRLQENLVEKWKGVVADLREKGEVPSWHHISEFVRKRVRAEFDPDFSHIQDDITTSRRFKCVIEKWVTLLDFVA